MIAATPRIANSHQLRAKRSSISALLMLRHGLPLPAPSHALVLML